ncbi:MAG TPA: SDR family oxidoreductase, partial [Marmoricola sp.]|nr:SDR family oxidoreductase [Marmoricola sp.]
HYTKLAALDLNPRIRVNAIACGSIMTSALEIVASDKNLMAEMTGATPLREVGIPEDIAAAVVYLSSPAGRYLTGKVLEVDGGLQVPNFSMPIPDVES